VVFPEINIDDDLVDAISAKCCDQYILSLSEDEECYEAWFPNCSVDFLQSKVVRVSYIKNFLVEGLSDHFEQPTDYLFHIIRYIYSRFK
jgi:hypothetical protein